MRRVAGLLALMLAVSLEAAATDAERLARGLEYFRAAQYHECLLLLAPLDSAYQLNPRYRAFLGVCYYHEADYKRAAACLDETLPQLSLFSPQERSLYYWTAAESHFLQGEYAQALPLYDTMSSLCLPPDRADALYRLAFCHMYTEEWSLAYEYFCSALAYYRRYRQADSAARIAQTRHMIAGIIGKMK